MTGHNEMTRIGLALALASVVAGCGPAQTPLERAQEQGLSSDNGLSPNGLSQNGLSQNGLSQNGLSQNGLSQNGLSQNGFATWFNQNVTNGNVVMSYLVRCAVASGQTRTWMNPATGVTYTWAGALGLAPGWAGGAPASVAEQQVITACLAAHVNKYGVHVPVAIEGRTATGVQIPIGTGELTTYSVREACFFGNLFTDEGTFAGIDHKTWSAPSSSARACAFDNTGTSGLSPECPPMIFVGACSSFCSLDKSKTFYESCTWNGRTYKPITTRLRSQEIYTCGDGVCQFTELCGTRSEWWQCRDCGPCP
jgi:hypothetical protein